MLGIEPRLVGGKQVYFLCAMQRLFKLIVDHCMKAQDHSIFSSLRSSFRKPPTSTTGRTCLDWFSASTRSHSTSTRRDSSATRSRTSTEKSPSARLIFVLTLVLDRQGLGAEGPWLQMSNHYVGAWFESRRPKFSFNAVHLIPDSTLWLLLSFISPGSPYKNLPSPQHQAAQLKLYFYLYPSI